MALRSVKIPGVVNDADRLQTNRPAKVFPIRKLHACGISCCESLRGANLLI
jgi:hypothetical protein